ncbi:very short patch repair endonuclease [Pseudomonas rhizosphaerae]|uniref:very short patch repair endonuclease n=1 Tax=Pseudomonas rhizosphaerae TaxID=216142 RepID=UPI000A005BE7|nr:very short patch repair endonuclease [Pseudomonas rhizosphaerae]
MDTEKELRSRIMRSVKREHTAPEIVVRKQLHAMGFRFRLHRRDLPGSPDIVLPKFKTVIFVNGCFWHRHPGCRLASMPKTRHEFWSAKFAANIKRDAESSEKLRLMGWRVLTYWQCELRDLDSLHERIKGDFNL